MELYKKYDKIILATLTNIYTLSKDKKGICLNNFNFKNKNHLFFLEVSKISSQVFHKNIYLNMNIFRYLFLKLTKFRKNKNICYSNKSIGIDIDSVLNFMKKEFNENDNIYIDIYNEYYGGTNV